MDDQKNNPPKAVEAPTPAIPAPNPDNITLKTPNGTVVVMKGYVSGGDMDELKRVLLSNVVYKIDPASGDMIRTTDEIKGTFTLDKSKKALELLIISVNGSTESPAQKVRDLPQADYNIVRDKVDEISGPLAPTPSKS